MPDDSKLAKISLPRYFSVTVNVSENIYITELTERILIIFI